MQLTLQLGVQDPPGGGLGVGGGGGGGGGDGLPPPPPSTLQDQGVRKPGGSFWWMPGVQLCKQAAYLARVEPPLIRSGPYKDDTSDNMAMEVLVPI